MSGRKRPISRVGLSRVLRRSDYEQGQKQTRFVRRSQPYTKTRHSDLQGAEIRKLEDKINSTVNSSFPSSSAPIRWVFLSNSVALISKFIVSATTMERKLKVSLRKWLDLLKKGVIRFTVRRVQGVLVVWQLNKLCFWQPVSKNYLGSGCYAFF